MQVEMRFNDKYIYKSYELTREEIFCRKARSKRNVMELFELLLKLLNLLSVFKILNIQSSSEEQLWILRLLYAHVLWL